MGKEATKRSAAHNARFETRNKDEIISTLIQALKERHVTDKQIDDLLARGKILLPISIFDNDKLSALESTVKYLKEHRALTFSTISQLLNRDARSIWTTYANARDKMKGALKTSPSAFSIPADILADRRLSVLETFVRYLKVELELSNREIATLLRRNDRTIWTVYNRAKKKLGGAA